MNKKLAFVLLVQTWILAREIGNRNSPDPAVYANFAISTLAHAMRIPEEIIPDNIEEACREYCYWQSRHAGAERPSWLPPTPLT